MNTRLLSFAPYIQTPLKKLALLAFIGLGLTACATQTTSTAIKPTSVNTYSPVYSGQKTAIVVGDFDNRSDYARGLFSANTDRLSGQAKTVLKTHLQNSNRFILFDRDSAALIASEAKLRQQTVKFKGAEYIITGAVTEFGRKVVGDTQLFGIVGSGKQQIAYAKVQLNITDVATAEVVQAVQGAGEYALSEREVLGFGSRAGYDSTLNGKVLDLAVREAVNNLVEQIITGRWEP